VNKAIFFAIAAAVAIIAAGTMWFVLSLDDQKPAISGQKNTQSTTADTPAATSADTSITAGTNSSTESSADSNINSSSDSTNNSHTATQPQQEPGASPDAITLRGLPAGTRDIPLHTSLSSLTDDKIISLIYGPASSRFQDHGKVLFSKDFNQGNKFKHIFISTIDWQAENKGCYTAYVFAQSGTMWILEAKAIRPYNKHTVVRWRRIGHDSFALIEKIKMHDQSKSSVELGVYALSGSLAQCMINFSQNQQQ